MRCDAFSLFNSIEMISFGFLLLAFLAFCSAQSNFAFASNCTLDSNEGKALEDIARILGRNDNYDTSNWTVPENNKSSDNSVWCNCSYAGNTVCHITHIRLKSQNLTGVLPTELTKLSYLQEIDLTRNYLNGTIPAEWGSLNLVNISLGANRLTGSIPKELGNITTLESLVVEFNDLSENLPPHLGNLSRIKRLHLTSNNFTGELPPEFAKLTALKEFRIGGNQFSGKIPDYIQNWTNLEQLVMVGSGFSGPIPSTIFSSLKNLSNLQISDLSGPDSTFPQLNETGPWKTLILRNCNIIGTLPPYLEKMKPFTILDLSFNKLSGPIPYMSTNLTKVKQIYLSGNHLTGPLPEWTANMNKDNEGIYPIDLSYNNFTIGSQTECENKNRNLFGISSTVNNSNRYFCVDTSTCSLATSLLINCGGDSLPHGDKTYNADSREAGAAYFGQHGKNWALSNTGTFVDSHTSPRKYIVSDEHNMMNDTLYQTARVSPISLTYYGYCLRDGTYTVRLHFAEIMFTKDKTYSSLGKRVFNIYIQGELVRENFDIVKAAGDVGHVTIQNFTTVVNSSGTLEIRFYWAGKGTTAIPFKSVYGPLISAISVEGGDLSQSGHGSSLSAGAVVGIVAAVVIIIILVFALLWLRGCLGQKNSLARDIKDLELQTSFFSLRQIKAATNNFDITNKIGEGGFGPVYKGFLPDGTIIAVKLLSSKSKQGNREFITEIGMISGLQHPYLVKLYGCCVDGDHLLLVYEYMENNSLARALFGQEKSQIRLDWPTRYKICVGIAKGLAYLHEESRLKIVHRDIKATNVLLDKNLNPKISDFGLDIS